MWILAAGTLGIAALMVLVQARSRATAQQGTRRAIDRAREMVP
jgi:hypothetical protein